MVKFSWDTIKTIVLIITVFMLLDYYSHQYLEKEQNLQIVPAYYYIHKILFGVPLFIAGLYIASFFNVSEMLKSIIPGAVTVFGLSYSYYLQYDAKTNITILALHSIILIPLTYFAGKQKWLI